MIIDVIGNTEKVEGLNPWFKAVFDYMRTHDLVNMPVGRIDVAGDDAYIKIEDARGRSVGEAVYERHDKYIDIQMPLSGQESYGWKAKSRLGEESAPYNKEGDYTFYKDRVEDVLFTLSPGEFVIFFPEDAHAPCIGEGVIRKMVAKVKDSVI